MPYLERDGDVFILYLGNEGETDNENRFGLSGSTLFTASWTRSKRTRGPQPW